MSKRATVFWGAALILISLFFVSARADASYNLPDPYSWAPEFFDVDTIPLEDRHGNWIQDPNTNPFDLLDPEPVVRNVEYDPLTNTYIITEKIGNEHYRPPTVMTFDEYFEWVSKQEETAYFDYLSGTASGDRSKGGNLDPVAQVDIADDIIDRLFGGTTVDIRPQGNVDLTFGVDYYRQDNPILPLRQRRNGPQFDFDMDIQVDVNGQIGEKLKTAFNYNTSRTFDFQNKLKLDYNSDLFSEDDILKSIEAGNVSLPLRSNLIQGSQNLFGIKTQLQFGHLRLTAIASQQNSKQNSLQIQGGSILQEYEIYADQYDENRHFFLSHFNRNSFEPALSNLPQINSLFRITRLEVWVTNDRNQTTDVRDIVAIGDLGEWKRMSVPNPDMWRNPDTSSLHDIYKREILPDNSTNSILRTLQLNPSNRDINLVVKTLQDPPFSFSSPRDFEKVQARRLNSNEYRFHPELGVLSLNIRVDQDEVIGVAYEYTYNGKVYQVGELSQDVENTDTLGTQKVLFVKMLKATSQRVDQPIWDLMMKNIYRIGGGDIDPGEFEFDIFYDNPGKGFLRFLPEDANLQNTPLLRIFNLDNLNATGDPQPDGRFDFVTGLTINPALGIVMFPVLEPFGSSLERRISAAGGDVAKYVYHQLYDSTIVRAREFPELNRFTLKGKAKSSTSADISLGAFNIPPGSVRVTAGGQILKENEDYVIDYNIGRLKILNQAYLQPGTPINVSFEDNALFSFSRKTMVGLRADYQVNKKMSLGATYMHMFERPFTQKVNIGDDPINNRIYGLDMNFSSEAPWLTKLVDKIPLLNTTAPSNITFEAEVAALKPGHPRAIDKGKRDSEGVVYLDDFEGTSSNFDLRQPAVAWVLASTPQYAEINGQEKFREAHLINDLRYGANRALINWYRIDQGARSSAQSDNNPYTRLVNQNEIFRNRTPRFGFNDFRTFDITYYPDQRGPYNFDPPSGNPGFSFGLDQGCRLLAPEERWGGIMRSLPQVNFEQANIEALEFWMLDPFLLDEYGSEGQIIFQLGNISEDILRDSRKFSEHSLPLGPNDGISDTTVWGAVPRIQATVNGFSNDPDARAKQDVGLDGLNDDAERLFYADYLNLLQQAGVSADCIINTQTDPSNDNYYFFLDENKFPPGTGVLERYRYFNGPEGNSPPPNANANRVNASTNTPDNEDINNDNTMSENESYFEYVVRIERDPNGSNATGNLVRSNPLITDVVTTINGTWYRFKIPLNQPTRAVNGMNDFRSVRFMRMFLTEFSQQTTLRFATLDLVRNQWRRVANDKVCEITDTPTEIIIDAVNVEEHAERLPFRYDIPLGIQRERITSSTYQDILQNEQSLSLKFVSLVDGCERKVYKNLDLDLRVFKRIQMFVHAEEEDMNDPRGQIPDGAVKLFVRFGSDFENNYYEYEVPLVMSKNPALTGDAYKTELWRPENEVEFSLEDLTNLKIERNAVGASLTDTFSRHITQIIHGIEVPRVFRIKGNPTLGYVRNIMIGVRNSEGDEFVGPYYGEVWVNELRVVGLEERGGVAGVARLDADLADFGSVGIAGSFSTIGWGAIDQKLDDRAKESVGQFDISTSLQLGKFFGKNSKLQIPFYYQYSQTVRNPQFDAIDLDLPLKEKLRSIDNQDIRDSVREQSIDFSSLRQISFTNVRKEPSRQSGASYPWDISNFTASYSHSRAHIHNVIIEKDQLDQHRGSIDYTYSIPIQPIQPFKNLSKSNWLKWLTEINLNPIPNTFTFGTIVERRFNERSYRFSDPIYKTWYDKRFTWDRDYSVRWDLTKSIKINFTAANFAVIDEPDEYIQREPDIVRIDPRVRNDSIWTNIKRFGRTKDYGHQLRVTYNLPFKHFPILDWIRADISYDATYGWKAASINTDSLGNVIQNGQDRQISGELDFIKLYNKLPLLAKINRPPGSRSGATPPRQSTGQARDNRSGSGSQTNARDTGKNQDVNPAVKAILRPLMAIRKLRVNYSEKMGTTIPGFVPQSRLLGLSEGFDAPGWNFIAGIQPKINRRADQEFGDYLDKARSSAWITTNPFQNAQVLQNHSKTIDGRLTIEPFTDFKIDIDASRNLSDNFSVYFKTYGLFDNSVDSIGRRTPRQIGSMTMSFYSLPTLFMDDSLQINQLFSKFESNRQIISKLRGDGEHAVDGKEYAEGFGRKQQDVLVPAFIAAYTGKDPTNFEFSDMFNWLPRPNWTLNYNGLSKLKIFQNVFSNVRISHGYKSTLTINSFESDLSYDDFDENTGTYLGQRNPDNLDEISQNYYSRFLVPSIVIDESFAPLLGIEVKTKNDMVFTFNYNKKRNLQMGFISYELAESQSTTIDLGFDWKLKNVRIGFLPGFNSMANKKKSGRPQQQPGAGTPKQGNDLDLSFDLSFSDNITVNHLLDQQIGARPTRGSKDISISPALSYDVNKNVSLRFFVDYRRQEPYVSNSYVVVNTEGGITVRIKLE